MKMKMKVDRRLIRYTLVVPFLGVLLSAQALAQSNEVSADEWEHSLAVYLWGADIGGTTARGTGVNVDFSDIVDNLKMAFMGAYAARKGKWSVMTDALYLNVSASKTLDLLPPISPIEVTTDARIDLKGLVIHLVGGYNLVQNEKSGLDLIFGARYLDLSTDLNLNFDLGLGGPPLNVPLSASGDALDAIIGLKGKLNLSERWFIPYYVDIGAGDSELTWQTTAGITYRAGQKIDVALAYRHLEWDLDATLTDDLNFSGPLLGVIFRF
jgi:opacity protein-like surface antigen